VTLRPTQRGLEVAIGTVTVLIATLAILISSATLGLLGLVGGAIGYGMLLGRSLL